MYTSRTLFAYAFGAWRFEPSRLLSCQRFGESRESHCLFDIVQQLRLARIQVGTKAADIVFSFSSSNGWLEFLFAKCQHVARHVSKHTIHDVILHTDIDVMKQHLFVGRPEQFACGSLEI